MLIYMNKYLIDWVPSKQINTNIIQNLLQASINTGRFTNYGPCVQLLESSVRDKFKVMDTKAVIIVANGSVALHVLTTAIQLYHNQDIKWATQSFTFPSSAQGNLHNVKIVDIDMDGGLNCDEVDETVDGFIVTNIFGNVVNIDKYIEFANTHNKYLIFDNAATGYTMYKGKNALNYGVGCTVSFHHTKPFGFGEGGLIIVDEKYEKHVRCLINFGMNLTNKYYLSDGNNHKMSDISAAYIIQYLDNFDNIVQSHYALYRYFISQINILALPFKLYPSFHDNIITPACFPIIFTQYSIHQIENIQAKLLENSIFCKKYYHPLINTLNATYIYDHILCIPCTIDMKSTDIDMIITVIRNTIV